MAYGKKFRFLFESQNGSEIEIFILKKNYTGPVITRPLGRAPVLKRESSGCIYGTSLEIYAECREDQEYATLYSSSADEHKVELYKDGELLWVGYISPELYSEPDIAPPYDVQIIATDGLGELKRSTFQLTGTYALRFHLRYLLQYTNLDLDIQEIMILQGDGINVLNLYTTLVPLNGRNCYDVLQQLLASIHATITQHDGKWIVFRETDLREQINPRGLSIVQNGTTSILPIGLFGSANHNDWWPIGSLSYTVEPAANSVSINSETSYLNPYKNWEMVGELVSYDQEKDSYIIPDASGIANPNPAGGIRQLLESKHDFNWSMTLRFKASLVLPEDTGIKDDDRCRDLAIMIRATSPFGAQYFYYTNNGQFLWGTGQLPRQEFKWSLNEGEQDIEIEIPLHASDRYSFTAKDIYIYIRRDQRDNGEITISDLSIYPTNQYPSMALSGIINNNARGSSENIDIIFPTSHVIKSTSNPQETVACVPLTSAKDYIAKWRKEGANAEQDYSTFIVTDYAESVALPRMNVTGKLNVGFGRRPLLMYRRDDVYYVTKNYTYDLFNDEIDITLLSIPNAAVEVESIVDEAYASAGSSGGSYSSTSGTSGSGSGSGTSSSLRDIYKQLSALNERVNRLTQIWILSDNGNIITTDKEVIIDNNLVVSGDTASAADGQDTPSSGGGLDLATLEQYLAKIGNIDSSNIGSQSVAKAKKLVTSDLADAVTISTDKTANFLGAAVFNGVLNANEPANFLSHVYIDPASNFMLGTGGVGIYLTKNAISWHNESNRWSSSLMSFEKTAIKISQVLRPDSNQLCTLGSSDYRWSAVYAGSGNFSNNVDIQGNLVVYGDVAVI